jgi:hypothetical protein
LLVLAVSGCGGRDDDPGAPSEGRADGPSAGAAKLLYEALGNAAGEPTIRVEMHRMTFATEENSHKRRRPTSEASSVSELDIAGGDFRSAYASKLSGERGFIVGRCDDGADYRDFARQSRPPSLARAQALLDHLQKASTELSFSPCPHAGVIAGAPPDLALARMSDGVFPVTLTKDQAQTWVRGLAAADLFDVVDEGTVDVDGRKLRKLSFAPKASIQDANRRLYELFTEAGEIEKLARLKKRHPDVEYEYEFISIGVANHGNVRGHYLVDPETLLPTSSELEGTGNAGNSGWARTRQTYAFPERLSLTASSPVDLPTR